MRISGKTARVALLPVLLLFLAPLVGCGSVNSGQAVTVPADSSTQAAASTSSGILYVGVMVHIEGYQNESNNKAMFDEHAAMVREYAEIFERNGARLTLEASPEFVQGCINFGDNVLAELAARGHAVGLHADLGGEPGLTQETFTSRLGQMKKQIESLGVPVRHVSGIVSPLDWVKAVGDTGFKFVDGIVEYAVKSLSPENVPAEYQQALAARSPREAHGTIPYELADRMHPWRMESGSNWLTASPSGAVVIIPGSSGVTMNNAAEAAAGQSSTTRIPITDEDIGAFKNQVAQALALVDPGKVNVFYQAWSVGKRQDAEMVARWASSLKQYVDSGQVQWKTIPEMYDAYVAWES